MKIHWVVSSLVNFANVLDKELQSYIYPHATNETLQECYPSALAGETLQADCPSFPAADTITTPCA